MHVLHKGQGRSADERSSEIPVGRQTIVRNALGRHLILLIFGNYLVQNSGHILFYKHFDQMQLAYRTLTTAKIVLSEMR